METNRSVHSNYPIYLTKAQQMLKAKGLSALLVRSTDKYFNEYVPKDLSLRTKLTGFDGSVGDAIITQKDAHLFVDGRYSLQARKQAQGYLVHICQNALSIENAWLAKLCELLMPKETLAYDPNTIDLSLFDKMANSLGALSIKLDPCGLDIISELFDPTEQIPKHAEVVRIPKEISGNTCAQKIAMMESFLKSNEIDGFLSVKLDDIAWLSNLRSYYFPYQSSLPGIALVMKNRIVLAAPFGADSLQSVKDAQIEVVKEAEFFTAIDKSLKGSMRILGIDASETSKAHEIGLQSVDIAIKRVGNPISLLKAVKNENELLHLRHAFKKADEVVYQTQNFVIDSFEKEKEISEGDVDDNIKDGFKKSFATELSFRPICASGKNGAVIHYGTPDRKQVIEEGSLFLLDTGAYYEGGYATDLTRTFLAAKRAQSANDWQKEMFTLVLKASINGLSARLKRGCVGMQLDAIVRGPLWQRGLDFAHGTGHGIGINVHEFPPRIGPLSNTPLLEGQVFSIEPGLYFEDLGGVRIENLATIVADKNPTFIRILPLTFCPFDERLIEHKMLDSFEKEFLEYYRKEWSNKAPWPNLPPLREAKFL